MSGLFKQFKTNSEKETQGVEISLDEAINDDGTVPTFIISRMGKSNKAYAKALEAATRPYRRQVDLGTLKNEIAENLFMGVFVDVVLKGWKNVVGVNGELLAYSKEAAIVLLTELPDVYERLQEEAKLASNFRDSSMDEEAKNS